VQPEIQLGPLDLKSFGLAFAFAFLAATGIVARRLEELGRPRDWAYELIFAALAGGLIGSRVDYIAQNYDKVSGDLLGNLFSGAGLVWYGGFLGGAVGVCMWAWWRGWLGRELLDVVAPGLALGYALGRIGCQVSGDGDYGIHSSLPWAMAYPHGTVPTTQEVHPTPIYETLATGMIALGLWRLRDRVRPGGLFALYLVLAGLERLLVEFIRRNDDLVAGLTLPQVISLGMVAAGGAWLVARRPLVAASA
jgi:phosphatidylglycerol---prolipoprotein diacylglyceryl transferase